MTDYSAWTQSMIADAETKLASAPEPVDNESDAEQEIGDEVATGPLSQMLIDNAPLIDAAIAAYGVDSVSAFFIDVGTGIAHVHGLDTSPAPDSEPQQEGDK